MVLVLVQAVAGDIGVVTLVRLPLFQGPPEVAVAEAGPRLPEGKVHLDEAAGEIVKGTVGQCRAQGREALLGGGIPVTIDAQNDH